jgi:DNA-binding MarR family transcriptional regulator
MTTRDATASMDEGRRSYAEQRFVEELGLFFELQGLPRMAGRIWGFLLVSDAAEVPAAELATGLQASAGSVSTATRLLVQTGLVRRVRRPGERRDWFALAPDGLERLLGLRLAALAEGTRFVARWSEVFAERPVVRARLDELHDLYAYLEREFPRLVDAWLATRTAPEESA